MRLSKKNNLPKKAVILFGPPGAGKGTQASLLAAKYSFYYLETSEILEESFSNPDTDFIKIEGKKYYFKKQKKLWEEGLLCDPPFVSFLIKKKIKEIFGKKESLVLAGSPRSVYEGEAIIPLLKKLYGRENIKIILLNLSAERSVFRNSHRRICNFFRHPILYNEETEKITRCPLDGSALNKRKSIDDPKVIKVRLKEYKERTLPLVNYFEKNSLEVERISGAGSPAEVFEQIIKLIND
jgi:adenylate kinase